MNWSRRPGPRRRHRIPGPKWLTLVVAAAMMISVLALNGLVNPQVGTDAKRQAARGADGSVPVAVHEGGSVVDTTRHQLRSFAVPAMTVALTFDDGPDPAWTPEILAVLREHGVPATFFVLGSMAGQHPQLLRDIRDAGSEIGVHTFTHPDLTTVTPERVTREMSQTQLAIAGATGQISYLVRPPYSSEVSALDDEQFAVVRQLGDLGFVTAFSDIDSRDWERNGVEAIVRASTPATGTGGVVLMHDAGGDRSETVAALDLLIPRLKAEGYTFRTVTQAVGLPPAGQGASFEDRSVGIGLVTGVAVATGIVWFLEGSLLVVGILVILRLLIMLVVAGRHARRSRRAPDTAPVTEPVTVIVPAYDEKECIEATVRSIAASDHPVEIIVVDDGSTDGTAEIVEGLALPGVRLIRQANGGKPAALNAGIAAASHELIVMVDGDTVFEPGTVRALVQPFASPEVGAVAGNAKVANRTSLVARWQHIEYVIGFNLDRRVQDQWRCMTTVPGAVGAFRRSALLAVGGVSDDTLAEDTDLTMALGRAGWRVVFEERARAWTEAPATLGELWRQRYRWSYGTIQSLWKHRAAVVSRGPSGRFGRVGLVNVGLFQVVLPLLAPLVDIFLIYGLIFLDPVLTLAAWAGVLAVQLAGAAYAFRLEREKLRALWLLPLQQLVYRQLMYAVLIQSIGTALTGIRLRWQKLNRVGAFETAPAQDRSNSRAASARTIPALPSDTSLRSDGGCESSASHASATSTVDFSTACDGNNPVTTDCARSLVRRCQTSDTSAK